MNNNSEVEGEEERAEDEEIYEQDEVIWAKIKGYPWWPAYVRSVNDENSEGEMEYTVYFFGDNTQYLSSRLGQSKIRKFLYKYPEFYKSAKVNRKLKLSIIKAEEKLKENGQNVDVYDEIRAKIKGAKRGRKAAGCKTDSKVDSSDIHINAFDTPELSKHVHQLKDKIKTHEPRIQKSLSKNEAPESSSNAAGAKGGSNPRIQEEQDSQQNDDERKNTKQKGVKERVTQRKPRGSRRGRRRGASRKRQVSPIKKDSSSSSEEEPKSEEERVEESESESSSSSEQQPETFAKRKRGGNRRGRRPSRRRPIRQQSSSSSSEQSPEKQREPSPEPQPQPSIQQQKRGPVKRGGRARGRKRIVRPPSEDENAPDKSNIMLEQQQPQPQEQIPDSLRENILQRIKFCLKNREELVETLIKAPITVQNIKEILDIGLSDILREGQITSDVRFLLEYLKSVLLYKYFPDDAKIRKKYEKSIKKKIALNKSEDRNGEVDYPLSNEDIEVRKKTIVKLQKIIRDEAAENSKQYAQKIQSFFRKRDPIIGDEYREIAYKVLRRLKVRMQLTKDKTEPVEQVMVKLETDEFE